MANNLTRKKVRKKGRSLLEFRNTYVIFDLETTDFSSDFGEIIEIGALKISNGKIIEKFNKLVKPKQIINEHIIKLTGITNEMLANEKDISVVGKEFKSFVGDNIIIGHNVNFDINFIYDNFLNYNIGIFDNDFIDTLRLARLAVKDSKNHKLKTLIQYFGFKDIGSHRSMPDTINTHKLYIELQKIYDNNPNLFKRKNKKNKKNFDLTLLECEIPDKDIDKDNYFYNLNVCFSGKMINFTKKEGGQIIANLGGKIQNNVTSKTDVLILGDTQKQIEIYGSKSAKHKKVLKMLSKGHEIQIMEESNILELIND